MGTKGKADRGKNIPSPKPGHIRLRLDDTFPEKNHQGQPIASTFVTVANDVCTIVSGLVMGSVLPDPRPIKVRITCEPVPWIDAISDPQFLIIHLAMKADDLVRLDYQRFVYQLGHELGHAVMGPLRTNGLIETLADAFSYEVLDRMTFQWRIKYRNPNHPWCAFAQGFMTYRKKIEARFLEGLPECIRSESGEPNWLLVSEYLRSNQDILEKHLTAEEGLRLRSLGAATLRREKVQWRDIVGISRLTNPSTVNDPSYRCDLQIDEDLLPEAVRKILTKIGRAVIDPEAG